MTLKEAIDKAHEIQNKVGTSCDGRLIEHIIPAPLDAHLFKSFVSEYYYLYNENEKSEIDFEKYYGEISANTFGVYYLLVGSELELKMENMPTWKILVR